MAEWVREQGVTDPELSPTHAWRHTFKQIAERVGITEKSHDAITGHESADASDSYVGEHSLKPLAEAMRALRFPGWTLAGVKRA